MRLYNDTYNNLRPRLFDGSHLDFPGMNQTITLQPHQKDAVWRGMSGGNTLLAHVVGAGKTFTMAATGMKMKQAGLIKKPIWRSASRANRRTEGSLSSKSERNPAMTAALGQPMRPKASAALALTRESPSARAKLSGSRATAAAGPRLPSAARRTTTHARIRRR